jgi:hypothetical protein
MKTSLRQFIWEWLLAAIWAALLFALFIAALHVGDWAAASLVWLIFGGLVLCIIYYMVVCYPVGHLILHDREAEHEPACDGVDHVISRFTLGHHHGPRETWPLRSRLFLDGEPTRIALPGYTLLHQFELPDGYILVTDYDCPFEEETNFVLISKSLHVLSWRRLGAIYWSFLLDRVEWIDERTFVAVVCGELCFRFTIRAWGIPYLRPRLKVKYLGRRVSADHGEISTIVSGASK